MTDIKGLGKKHEVKEVKEGYVRNFLFPKKLVISATSEALQRLSKEKAEAEKDHALLVAKLAEEVKKLRSLKLIFQLKTRDTNEVFGSVNRVQIEKALHEKGFSDFKIELERPIKTLGEKKLIVDLGAGVKSEIEIIVEPQSR